MAELTAELNSKKNERERNIHCNILSMQFDRKTKVLRLISLSVSLNLNESLIGNVFAFLGVKQTYFCSVTLTDKRVTACPGGVLGCGFENGCKN